MIGFCKINKIVVLSEACCYYCVNDFIETKAGCFVDETPEWLNEQFYKQRRLECLEKLE